MKCCKSCNSKRFIILNDKLALCNKCGEKSEIKRLPKHISLVEAMKDYVPQKIDITRGLASF